MINPLPFHRPVTQKVGEFAIKKTYDAWEDAQTKTWSRESGDYDRVSEFIKIVQDVIGAFKTYEQMAKFFRKYGVTADQNAYGFNLEGKLLDYTVIMCGEWVEISGYRKEK